MDENAVDRMYQGIMEVIVGQDHESVMVVLGAIHNEYATRCTSDSDKLRELYDMMGDAAILLATIDDTNKLQAQTNPSSKKKRKKARQKTRDEPGPFGPN